MKKPLFALFALSVLLLTACDAGAGQETGNTTVNITWISDDIVENSGSCYIDILMGAIEIGNVPDSVTSVYNERIYTSTRTVYANLSESGRYTAWIYFDRNGDSSFTGDGADMAVGCKQFTFTDGATVDINARY